MKLPEVMKAIESADGGEVVLEDVVAAPVAVASTAAAVSSTEESGTVDSAQMGQLRKQLQDLEEIAKSREQQIEQVRVILRLSSFSPLEIKYSRSAHSYPTIRKKTRNESIRLP